MPITSGAAGGPLVERGDEQSALADLIDRAVDGRGGMARVVGEAGVGKTSLVGAAAARALAEGMSVLATAAGELDSRSPYGVVRRLLDRPLAALSGADRVRVSEGPAHLAVEHLLRGTTVPVDQGDLLNSLSWLLADLADLGPVLLVVDDAQWADEESLLFLGSLCDRLHDLPVLVVLATREVAAEERSAALAALVADRSATELRLERLSTDGVRSLLERGWGAPVPADVVVEVAGVTGGNPFLVLALARLLERETALSVDVVRAAVPTSVVDTVVARLATVGEDERGLAQAVAILETASTRTAGDLAGLELDRASLAADRLRSAGLLSEEPVLRFRHALLRSAVHAATPPGQRDQLHRAAARLLSADTHAASAQLIAAHGVGDPWAVDLLRRAAALALDEGAPQSAVVLLRRARAEPPDDASLPVVLLEPRPGRDALHRPGVRADPAARRGPGDRSGEPGPVCPRTGRCLQLRRLPRRRSGGPGACPRGPGHRRPQLRLEVEAALIAASLLVPDRVHDARRRLAARPDLAGDTPAERLFLMQQLANAAGTNQPASVIRGLAGRVVTESDTPERTDWGWGRLFLAAVGELDDVRRLTDTGFEQAAERGSVIGFVTASFVRGLAEYWAGALVPAEAHFRAMLEHGAALNGGSLVPLLAGGNLAQTLAWQGRVDAALDLLSPFPEELPETDPVNGLVTMAFARADVRRMAGDHAGALRAAEYAGQLVAELDVDSPTWGAWRAFAIDPLRSLGRLDEARTMAADHLTLCERSEVDHLLGEALRLAAEVAEHPDEGIALHTRSVAVLARSQSRLQEARSRVGLGAALRRTGRRSEAQPHLVTGRDLAQGCGARTLVTVAEAELAACGSRLRRLELSGVAALTASERRVAELAAAGLRNSEIARQLFVTTKTVETHLSRAYRKLGVAGREGLAPLLSRPGRPGRGDDVTPLPG